jgi:hypothetical protein
VSDHLKLLGLPGEERVCADTNAWYRIIGYRATRLPGAESRTTGPSPDTVVREARTDSIKPNGSKTNRSQDWSGSGD